MNGKKARALRRKVFGEGAATRLPSHTKAQSMGMLGRMREKVPILFWRRAAHPKRRIYQQSKKIYQQSKKQV